LWLWFPWFSLKVGDAEFRFKQVISGEEGA